MNPARHIIFKAMDPQEIPLHLCNKKSSDLVWLLRESRESGMLTVSFRLFSNNIPVYTGNTRYALTAKGWISATNITEEVKEALKTMQFVDRKCAGKYVSQLLEIITSNSLVIEKGSEPITYKFNKEDQVTPNSDMQTTNETYLDYFF